MVKRVFCMWRYNPTAKNNPLKQKLGWVYCYGLCIIRYPSYLLAVE